MAWTIVAVLFGLLVVWRLGRLIAGGPGSEVAATGNGSTSSQSPAPSATTSGGSVSAAFPQQVKGARIELKVFGLGTTPGSCTGANLSVGGTVRTVYDFDCERLEAPASSAYFFWVRLTNVTDVNVPADPNRFVVETADGRTLAPFDAGAATFQRPFASTNLLPGASVKGWITFDGSPRFTPVSLGYIDVSQTLTVRFEGKWA